MCKRTFHCLLLIILTFSSTRPAFAHSNVGTLQIADETVGIYRLNVWTTPEILRPGEILIVAIITAESGTPVLNCDVTYFLQSTGSGEQQVYPAAQATAESGFSYETAVQLSDPGTYLIEIEIIAPDGTSSVSTFDIEIVPISPIAKLAIYMAIVTTLILCIWFGREAFRFWRPYLVTHQLI